VNEEIVIDRPLVGSVWSAYPSMHWHCLYGRKRTHVNYPQRFSSI